MKLRDLWILFPIGAGGLLGVMSRYNINYLAKGLGFDRESEEIAGGLTALIGAYLMITTEGFLQNVGTGMSVIGTTLLVGGMFDPSVIEDRFELFDYQEQDIEQNNEVNNEH